MNIVEYYYYRFHAGKQFLKLPPPYYQVANHGLQFHEGIVGIAETARLYPKTPFFHPLLQLLQHLRMPRSRNGSWASNFTSQTHLNSVSRRMISRASWCTSGVRFRSHRSVLIQEFSMAWIWRPVT